VIPFLILTLLAALLAWANGSNDISKGIATLVGSGVSNFRAAVIWGTLWTVGGGLVAAFASQGLVATFSGKGFLDRPASGPAFLSAVAIGAIAWVLFASRTGLPVSTTHAIAGPGRRGSWPKCGVLHGNLRPEGGPPLGLSPVISVLLVSAVFPLLARATARFEAYCLCLERRVVVAMPASGAMIAMSTTTETVVATEAECASSPTVAARLSAVDALHWVSSALTSLARGLNDTPKIVALGIVAAATVGVSGVPFYLVVALAMGAGSLFARVTGLSPEVTPMSPAKDSRPTS
jgi:PiT family inorganic phosphate transporter